MSIHARIKEGRLRLKLTEQQFADQVGVTRAAVQQWERENGTAPRRSKQEKVAQVLGISVAELVTGAAAPESEAATLPAAVQHLTPLGVPEPSTMAEALKTIGHLVQQLQGRLATQGLQDVLHIDHAWPFKGITRDQWLDLTDEQKAIVESVAAGMLTAHHSAGSGGQHDKRQAA